MLGLVILCNRGDLMKLISLNMTATDDLDSKPPDIALDSHNTPILENEWYMVEWPNQGVEQRFDENCKVTALKDSDQIWQYHDWFCEMRWNGQEVINGYDPDADL